MKKQNRSDNHIPKKRLIEFRATPTERHLIERIAWAHSMPVSRYVRLRALNKATYKPCPAINRFTAIQLAHVEANLTQIQNNLHDGWIFPFDERVLIEALEKTREIRVFLTEVTTGYHCVSRIPDPDESRTSRIVFRVNQAQQRAINARACAAGKTRSHFIRDLCFDGVSAFVPAISETTHKRVYDTGIRLNIISHAFNGHRMQHMDLGILYELMAAYNQIHRELKAGYREPRL